MVGLVLAGLFTEQQFLSWSNPEGMEIASRAVSTMPESLPGWTGVRFERSQRELDQTLASAAHCVRLQPVDRRNAEVSVMLLCGQSRGLAVHPPTNCFQGSGWIPLGTPIQRTFRSGEVTLELNQIDFTAREGGPPALRVYWGWSVDPRQWVAPENPRLALYKHHFVYKIYGSRVLTAAEAKQALDPGTVDPCQEALLATVTELIARRDSLSDPTSAGSTETADRSIPGHRYAGSHR